MHGGNLATMKKFKSLNLNVAVTALHAFKDEDIVLVGVGGFVEVIKNGVQIQLLHVFKDTSDSVHGFRPLGKSCILVFGGKSLASIECDNAGFKLSPTFGHIFADWAHDIVPIKDNSHILAVTAHNSVLRVNLANGQESTVRCLDENCILYSACLIHNQDESVVIGGTVFKEVIVWSCSERNQGKVYHRLRGHEGVIFSVQFNRKLSLICSTSDDRSARLWKVDTSVAWEHGSITPSHILSYAHTARVFRCLLSFEASLVITGGEDSIIAAWDIATGACKWKQIANDGSPIWSLAESKGCVIGGGGNGSVKRITLSNKGTVGATKITLHDKRDAPKIVQFVPEADKFLVLSQRGVLCSVDNNVLVDVLAQDAQLENYAVMTTTRNTVYLGTLNGKLMWGNIGSNFKLQEIILFNGKIFALTILRPSCRLLVCGKAGEMIVLLHTQEDKIVTAFKCKLPPVKEQPWFSCAAETDSRLIIGDRCGNIHIYSNEGEFVQSLNKIHGKHGVASVLVLNTRHFISTGRDGFLKLFAFEEETSDNAILEVSRHFKIDWLEKCLHQDSGEDILLGFQGNKFVVHTVSNGVSLAEVECGGGHRSWDFDGDSLVFVKDKTVMVATGLLTNSTLKSLRPSVHNREITCTCPVQLSSHQFLFTGSEDTTIKAWSWSEGKIKMVQSLRSHISSIKSIHVCSHPTLEDAKLMVTSGGRAQLKVWELSLVHQTLKVVELGSHLLKGNDKQRQKSWRSHDIIDDVETRYLSLCCLPENHQIIKLYAACSDGVIRAFSFDLLAKKITLLQETSTLSHAILKIDFIQDSIITASTSGTITVWSQKLRPRSEVLGVNQSGVNAMCIFDDDTLITGGDDGTITVTSIREKKIVTKKVQCHAAHVTGICKLGKNHFISCSIDQRITIWTLRDRSQLQVLAQSFSHVSNIQDMKAWKLLEDGAHEILVVGNGMEIIFVTLSE